MDRPEPPDSTQRPAPDQAREAADHPAPTNAAEIARLRSLLDEARRNEASALKAARFLAAIVNMAPIGLTADAENGVRLFANAAASELASVPAADAKMADKSGAGPDASGGRLHPDKKGADSLPAVSTEERVVGPDGERVILRRRRPARIMGRDLTLTASVDFTEQKQVESELSKRAYFDDLTGLPNRAFIEERVERLVAEAPSRFALAFIDIDNFKHINDYYTHAIGDALLVKIAARVNAHIRQSDVLGRISGDEFLLVLSPLERDEDLIALVHNLLQKLKEPFFVDGFEIFTSASIGVSVHPDHGVSYEALRRAADTAMCQVKQAAKGGAVLFDSDMGRAMTVRMAQEQRLRLAVRDGRFCCAFQPKVDLRTHDVVGVEALIRLRDEDGVIQNPGDFIALAIELGLIDDLTHLAFAEIVRSIALLDDAFGPEATISINIAAKQATDPKFMIAFCEELKATNFADRFMVEVTEDAFLAKNEFQTHVLPMLREMGTRVSVDDFGTGYSSLATLADVTADEIKIDRSFITDIHQRPRSQSVLKAIEALSYALGMTVIAEGVETVEEVAYLQAATRIRFGQGFYFARPILLEDLGPARRLQGGRAVANSRYRPRLRG